MNALTPAMALAGVSAPPLDYYLISAGTGDGRPAGIVVEEFVLADDFSAIGLDGAGWSLTDDNWWSSAAFSLGIRSDPTLRSRVVAASRAEAATVYRRSGSGDFPDEARLRTYFRDRAPLATAAPLRLTHESMPGDLHDRRVYRTLLAGDMSADRLASLRNAWQMTVTGTPAGMIGTAHRATEDERFRWELRRIGAGIAWAVDLTAYLSGAGTTLGPLLWELRTVVRQHGLIPVTVERFS
jgi:hypothetical protein